MPRASVAKRTVCPRPANAQLQQQAPPLQGTALPRRAPRAKDVSLFYMTGPGPLDRDLAKVRLERIYRKRIEAHSGEEPGCDICEGAPDCVSLSVAKDWLKSRGLVDSKGDLLPEGSPAA